MFLKQKVMIMYAEAHTSRNSSMFWLCLFLKKKENNGKPCDVCVLLKQLNINYGTVTDMTPLI